MVAVSSSSSDTVVEQRILPELRDDHIYIPLQYRRISSDTMPHLDWAFCDTFRAELQQALAVMGTL